VFLGFSTTYIRQNFQSNIVQHRNAIEARMYPEERTVAEYTHEHDVFREKCAASNVPYFEIRENYEEEIANVYAYIDREKKILDYEQR